MHVVLNGQSQNLYWIDNQLIKPLNCAPAGVVESGRLKVEIHSVNLNL